MSCVHNFLILQSLTYLLPKYIPLFFYFKHNFWGKIFHKPTYHEDSKLLGCYTMSLGRFLLTFWMQYDHSKHQLLFTNGHEQCIPKDQSSATVLRGCQILHIYHSLRLATYFVQHNVDSSAPWWQISHVLTLVIAVNATFLQSFHVKNGKEWCKLMAGIQWNWGTIAITR